MKKSEPPILSTWMLERLAPRDKRESMIGDLREQYDEGRSAWWYRRQVFTTIVAGVAADIGAHKLLAARAFIMSCAAFMLLGAFFGRVRDTLIIDWDWAPRTPEILRQAVVYYGLPFEIPVCLWLAATGWTIARCHRNSRVATVILSALAPWLWAIPWAWRTGRLLHAGLWPFWDFRLALLYHGVMFFVGYPLCILLGGLWDAGSAVESV
ncbi:MAG TPA: hypothetical protein VLV86_18785 [Vicinamibacterales bacterium]|nr:hypothetical protein [Vicinamibacterales bacterium]